MNETAKPAAKPPVVNETPAQLRRMNNSLRDKVEQLEKELENRKNMQRAAEDNNKSMLGELTKLKRNLSALDADCSMSIVFSENKPVEITMDGLWTTRKFQKIYRQILQKIRVELVAEKRKIQVQMDKTNPPAKQEKLEITEHDEEKE